MDIKTADTGFDHCGMKGVLGAYMPTVLTVSYPHHCNVTDACQRQTGSAFSWVVVAFTDKVKIEGDVKTYTKNGDSGNPVERIFCGTCGSPMAHTPDPNRQIIAIKAGILDKATKMQIGEPKDDIYTQDRVPAVTQRAGREFPGMPEL